MILYLKNLLKRRLLIVVLLAITISLAFITNFALRDLRKDSHLLSTASAASVIIEKSINQNINSFTFPLPIGIKIPSINVNSKIEQVGLTKNGAMGAPAGPKEIGWFSLGIRPGEIGSSVMDGHSGWKNNISAVFDDLYKIKIGDKIYVTDNKGITKIFVVKVIKRFDPKADATSVFTSNDGKAHLNLITCTGLWNKILKSHSQRLVVFTDLETK